jgi:hypothetical protein
LAGTAAQQGFFSPDCRPHDPNHTRQAIAKRILPKNITGKESCPTSSTTPFWPTTARAQEGCQLFTEKMLANRRDHRHEPGSAR